MFRSFHLFFLLCLFSQSLFGQIVKAQSMEEVRRLMGTLNKETLVIFDMDDTLITPLNPACQQANRHRYRYLIERQTWTSEQKSIANNLCTIGSKTDVQLVECGAVGLIHDIQAQGVPSIALTAAITCPLGEITSPLACRVEQLAGVGIDFSKTAPYVEFFRLKDLPSFLNSYPEGECGVICTGGKNKKGVVLAHYLKSICWTPTKVILVDDNYMQLNSLTAPMRALGIEYTGIYYRGIDHFKAAPIDAESFICFWKELEQKSAQILYELTCEVPTTTSPLRSSSPCRRCRRY